MSWYDQRISRLEAGSAPSRGSRLIFHEICRLDFAQMSEPQRIASLLEIAQHVAGIEGLEKTRIRLAHKVDEGTAAATFLDAPRSFERPAILLDRRFIAADVEPDVFVGLVLHEFGHLKFTRRFFLEGKDLLQYQRMICNLIEDYRIELLLAESSEAWRTYLERTRRRLVEEDGLARGLAQWEELSDLNRVTLLLGLFLFMPEVLAWRAELRNWVTADGICAFEVLKEIFASEPRTEDEVFAAAAELLRRFPVCQRANRELRISEEVMLWEEAYERDGWHWLQLSDQLRGRSLVSGPCDESLISQVNAANKELRLSASEMPEAEWRDDDASRTSRLPVRETVTPRSATAEQRYAEIVREYRVVVEELRQLFADPTQALSGRVSGQLAGRIDPRRLYRHGFDTRLFQHSLQQRKKLASTTVGLLLDASGSMRGLPEELALRLGVILCEAFRESRNVDVRIYSHLGLRDHCGLQQLGDKQTAAGFLGTYQALEVANYDDLALAGMARILEQRPAERRVLFVLSDARPTHRQHLGSRERYAMNLTRAEVGRLRGRGWRVIGLTVGQGAGRFIYGQDRVHLSVLSDIPTKFARLLRGLFGG